MHTRRVGSSFNINLPSLPHRLVAFRRLLEKAAELPELSAWLSQAAPEQCVPTLWDCEPASPPAPHSLAMYRLLLIQVPTIDKESIKS